MIIHERNRIDRAFLHDRAVPDAAHVELGPAVRGLFELVVQRCVEHAELHPTTNQHGQRGEGKGRRKRTCVPSASRYASRSSMESFQNSPTANILGRCVSARTDLTKSAMKLRSMCCVGTEVRMRITRKLTRGDGRKIAP